MNNNRTFKARRVFLFSLTTFLVGTIVVLAAGFLIKVNALSRNTVPIVSATIESQPTDNISLTAGSATSTAATIAETTLETIIDTPTDLDVDYDVDVITPATAPIYKQNKLDQNLVNVLFLSSDARAGQKSGRSDSMILFSYNRQQKSVKLTSFLRDTWVRIEGHGWNRINAAFSYGGVGLAVNTVNQNFGLDIQNYVTIRFEQFISIVDQLGGVAVNLTAPEIAYINQANPDAPLEATAGVKELNGAQALTHCRNRKVGGNGDFDRVRRQRETMLAILSELKDLRDPVALARLISFTLDHVETNMKPDEIFTLATEVLTADDLSSQTARVPFDKTWHYANESGRSVIQIDLAKNKSLLHDFIYGK